MEPIERQLEKESANIALLEAEKAALKTRILTSPMMPVPSPYGALSIRFAASAFALLLVVGVPFTYAAQKSAPGDRLYSLEVGLIEDLEEALQVTPKAKRQYHAARLEERLTEVKQAREQGTITQAQTEVVAALVKEEAAKVATSQEGSPQEVIEELVKAAAIVEAHEELLADISAEDSIEEAQDIVATAISKESDKLVEAEGAEAVALTVSEALAETAMPENDADESARLTERAQDASAELEKGDIEQALSIVTELRVEALKRGYLTDPAP